ncbi:MAG: hypothetical protein V7731_00335 [Amphritea sp.]
MTRIIDSKVLSAMSLFVAEQSPCSLLLNQHIEQRVFLDGNKTVIFR